MCWHCSRPWQYSREQTTKSGLAYILVERQNCTLKNKVGKKNFKEKKKESRERKKRGCGCCYFFKEVFSNKVVLGQSRKLRE